MKSINRIIQKVLIYIFSLLLIAGFPISVMAEDVPGAVNVDTTVEPGVQPAEPTKTYTYDESTGRWNSNFWYYDSTTGIYQAVTQPADDQAMSEPTVTEPTAETPLVETDMINNDKTDQVAGASADEAKTSQNSDLEADTSNDTQATNTIDSESRTGDATVAFNTLAQNAMTGDATAMATIINSVNTVSSLEDNQKVASFTTNVMGDVNGDILLQPMMLKAMLESGSSSGSSDIKIANSNDLTNNINLEATSGNAGVIGNTRAGNAESGSADTVANVVNIVNSMVAANQSFVGTVNIYGNLNGDILIAPDFIPQLIASNGEDVQDSKKVATIDSTDMQSIINNVSLAAQSGRSAVMDNTTAGDSTTGDANTNIVIFNLTGHDIIASNSLLVFVNVLGKWVGVIVDAPEGSTAAMIGSGVTNDAVVTPDLKIISDNSNQITNNINLISTSGNATVARNTMAGNALSGNATASANIANISRSQFGLSGWFGLLFINVFGTWNGSFGIDTPSGNQTIENNSGNITPQVIQFIPKSNKVDSDPVAVTVISRSDDSLSYKEQVLGDAISKVGLSPMPLKKLSSDSFDWLMTIGIMAVALISVLGVVWFIYARMVGLRHV
ncbi:hypothetical protein HGB24_02535 [Candidatus Saccharibacteria bacterium]|nr:hypothetical protein [Candidatus Saccharibacteria bacterium]